ncbi:uncharacterized protein [Mycetomoellerius zeteki]|uniref:uncharacterized protein n=1 Tax=Mycetomoellerius zeteki TaxID=64791 RepID=UPI00084E434C|nr:PREDICTED: uncharacterized protein LOC108725303 [Trachymyrmex zeteki]
MSYDVPCRAGGVKSVSTSYDVPCRAGGVKSVSTSYDVPCRAGGVNSVSTSFDAPCQNGGVNSVRSALQIRDIRLLFHLANRSATRIFQLHVISSAFGINISRANQAPQSTLDSKIELVELIPS